MFARFTSLFVAGAMVTAAGNVNAADYFDLNRGSIPSYVAGNSRNLNNGIAVGGCYPTSNAGNHWGSSSYGSRWSNDRWDHRNTGYGSSLPDHAPSYRPVYRPTTYNSLFNHNLPAYGHTTWNSNRPYYR